MKDRKKLLGTLGALGFIVIAVAIYFAFFRSSAPVDVSSSAAAQARQEAIVGATVADSTTTSYSDNNSTSNATASADSLDGTWTVDTSIGTFNNACLTDVCGSTFAGFRINEELASFGAKTVVGRTPDVAGSLALSGTQVTSANFVVDMSTLITDNDARTGALRRAAGGIETDAFPEARFDLLEPIELGQLPADGTSTTVQALGDLTIHGVTRTVTISLTAELQADVIVVFGNLTDIALADFDIPKPTAAVVVSVEDTATLELQLFLSR